MGTQAAGARTPLSDERIVALYGEILAPASLQRHDKTGGWFQRYCGRLAEPGQGERYLRAIRNSLKLQDQPVQGQKVLEVGSGFGLTCLSLALLGAESVHCLDTNEQMVDTMRSYLNDLPWPLPVHPQVGLAYALPYPDNHFDRVITVEAMSHFLHPERCVAEVHRVLKPGGQYIIADDNNALNDQSVKETHEVWDRFENGPPTEDIHGHRVREPYVDRRRRLIAAAYPALAGSELELLARRTAYMVKADILAAAQRYLIDKTLPDSTYRRDICPVEPESGQFIENLIDPLALTGQLEALGFQAQPEAYFGGESRGGLLYAANNLLNGLVPRSMLFARSDGFRIRAQKRS
ncbi:MAG: class I SAM-dependent methyltransferase [Rubrivivax sp.]|nr:class I SAM-dependent methyltransferase [Rubrivivax sp.]